MAAIAVRRPPLVTVLVPSCWHGDRVADFGVVHTTEGLGTVETYARFFERTPDKLLPTFLVERTGRAGIYVDRLTRKTYHVRDHNSQCFGIEQVGFSSTTREEWIRHYRRQLYMTAWLLAWGAAQFTDPIAPHQAGSDATGRKFIYQEGLTSHRWVRDNDHDDCGPERTHYPYDVVFGLAAKWFKNGGPTLSTRIYIATGHRPA